MKSTFYGSLRIEPFCSQSPRTVGSNRPWQFCRQHRQFGQGDSHCLKTVKNTLDGFKEVEKLYNDTKKYYDALKKVNNLIGMPIRSRVHPDGGRHLEIYVTSYKKMLSDKNFRPSELAAMASGYAKLLEQSGESLKELKSIVKSNVFSMNDHERMQAIDRIYTTLRENRSLVSVLHKEEHLRELGACKGEEQPCLC